MFEKAIKIYPASIEAWSALLAEYMLAEKWPLAAKTLNKALECILPAKSFLLFEEILCVQIDITNTDFYASAAEFFIPVLEQRPPELFPNFYGAMLLQRGGCLEEAEQWLDKALVMQPDFWYGRLLRLGLIRQKHPPLSSLEADLDYFLAQSGQIKRFLCSACGLNREQIFYCCQRCNSWHSATYKFALRD